MNSSPTGRDSVRVALAASTAGVCFGSSVVATRFAVAETNAVSLAFLRYAIACVVLLPVLWPIARARMPRRDVLAIAMLGVIFFGIFPWAFSASLVYSPSARVAVEMATMPLLTLLISRMRGYDRLTPPKVMGQLLAFAGLLIALRPGATHQAASGANIWLGDLLAGSAAVCGATFNVFSRPYLKRYPALHVTTLSIYAGVLFLAPIAATTGLFASMPRFTSTGWIAVVFLGTFGGAFGFSLWSWALQRSTPSRVAVFIALNPLTAITLGLLLLHEPVSTAFLIGFALVIAGIALANFTVNDRVAASPGR